MEHSGDNGEVIDVNKLARNELARLHRQYRQIEDQGHGYTHKTGKTALKTNRILDNLVLEKGRLLPDLSNASSKGNVERAKLTEAIVLEILSRFDKYAVAVDKEIRTAKEMEEQVIKIAERVVKQRLKILSLHGMSTTPPEAERKLCIAENKLYHVRTLFDTKCHENSELRKGVKDLLQERTRFHKKHNYLKKAVSRVKHEMQNVVHQAAWTYDNRQYPGGKCPVGSVRGWQTPVTTSSNSNHSEPKEESVAKCRLIREKEEKDSKQHILEVKEFQRVLHHDHKMHRFLFRKNEGRNVLEDPRHRIIRKAEEKEKEVDRILVGYRHSINEILSLAPFTSVDELCVFFEDLERENFSKFIYITDITHECEFLKDGISKIKVEIGSSKEIVEERRKSRMAELRDRQEEVFRKQDLLQHLETRTEESIDKLGKLIEGIATAFDLAGCSNSKVLQLLGNQNGVSQRNVLLCLGILEQEITALKLEKERLEIRERVNMKIPSFRNFRKTGTFIKRTGQGGPFKVEIIIPSHIGGAVEEEDEKVMEDRPYFVDEMREYLRYQLIEDGLIPDHQKFKSGINFTDLPSGRLSTADPSTLSLIDKVSSKKNARKKAQEEQERKLSKMPLQDPEEVGKWDVKEPENVTMPPPPFNGIELEATRGETSSGPEVTRSQRSSGKEEAGFTLNWLTSTEEEGVVFQPVALSPPSPLALSPQSPSELSPPSPLAVSPPSPSTLSFSDQQNDENE